VLPGYVQKFDLKIEKHDHDHHLMMMPFICCN